MLAHKRTRCGEPSCSGCAATSSLILRKRQCQILRECADYVDAIESTHWPSRGMMCVVLVEGF